MNAWLADNANLLSGIAALVTLISIVVPPLVRRKLGLQRASDTVLPVRSRTALIAPAASQIMPLSAAVTGPGAIAVIPFDSISVDPSDAHLADGITCEIISALSRAGCLHIAPRSDSFSLRGKSLSLAETAKQSERCPPCRRHSL